MKTKKRIISIAISFMMLLSMAPAMVYADEVVAEQDDVQTQEPAEITEVPEAPLSPDEGLQQELINNEESVVEEPVEEAAPVEEPVKDINSKGAAEGIAGGVTGDIEWTVDEDYTLIFSGNGKMATYDIGWEDEDTLDDGRPWARYRDKITKVVVEEGVTNISNSAISYMTELKTVEIASTVKEMRSFVYDEEGEYWYTDQHPIFSCPKLEAVNVAEGNEYYYSEDGVLYEEGGKWSDILVYYPSAKEADVFVVPNNVNQISDYAFSLVTGIKELVMNENVQAIGYSGICGESNSIEKLTIPATVVEHMEGEADDSLYFILMYGGFVNLKEIILLNESDSDFVVENGVVYSNTEDGKTLEFCPAKYSPEGGVFNVPSGVKAIGRLGFSNCTEIREVVLPNTVTRLDMWAFSECDNLKKVVIGSGLKDYMYDAFCWSPIEEFEVSSANKNICDVDGVLFTKDKKKIVGYPAGRAGSYSIPSGVTRIEEGAFYNASKLTGINIPNTVEEIGFYGFGECTSLTEVVLPNSIDVLEGGEFFNCTSLKSLTIPANVTEFGGYMLDQCPEDLVVYGYTNSFGECAARVDGKEFISLGTIAPYMVWSCYDRKQKIWYELDSSGTLFVEGDSGYIRLMGGYYSDFYGLEEMMEYENLIWNIVIEDGIYGINTDGLGGMGYVKSIVVPDSVYNIKSDALGWVWDYSSDSDDIPKIIKEDLVVYGSSRSDIEEYAWDNGIEFCVLDKDTCPKHLFDGEYVKDKATTSKVGHYVEVCSLCDFESKPIEVAQISSSKTKLNTTAYTYNGSAKKPGVTVKDVNGKTISSSNYTVSYASGRKNVGKYKVTITFKNKYSGKLTKEFKINPKGVAISKLTKAKKSFKVTWKKPTSKYRKQMTGYQIKYSTSSKMTSAKTVSVKSTTATSKTIKSLKAKKKYYVQLRTYKKIGSNYYYSGWSTKKTVTTK